MKRRGKRYTSLTKNFDAANRYQVAEAVALVKQTASAKFDES